jgi:hypothetical protein
MSNKLISSFLVVTLLNLLGCYSYQTITKDELGQAEKYTDLQVITKNKYTYEFDEGNYTFSKDSIYGSGKLKLKSGKRANEDYNGSIYFEEVEKLKMDGFDIVTTILVIAIPVALIVLAAASFSPLDEDTSVL